jgi:phosphoribosylanthranilate isomerase
VPVSFVKICGITRVEDARAAVECGASALGFVFWPKSPRRVDVDLAARIRSTLPPGISAIGVFVDQSSEEVNDIADRVDLTAVQLHGSEDLHYARQMRRRVIKALAVGGDVSPVLNTWPEDITVLLDVHDPVRKGGTGKVIDWVAAAGMAAQRKIILAGGLSPENVRDALARVRPYGIDVSSGVESQPGIKDHLRITALFEAVHGGHYAARP